MENVLGNDKEEQKVSGELKHIIQIILCIIVGAALVMLCVVAAVKAPSSVAALATLSTVSFIFYLGSRFGAKT